MSFIGLEFTRLSSPHHCYTVIKDPHKTSICLINDRGCPASCSSTFLETLIKVHPRSYCDYKITKFPGLDQINIF